MIGFFSGMNFGDTNVDIQLFHGLEPKIEKVEDNVENDTDNNENTPTTTEFEKENNVENENTTTTVESEKENNVENENTTTILSKSMTPELRRKRLFFKQNIVKFIRNFNNVISVHKKSGKVCFNMNCYFTARFICRLILVVY